MTVRSISVLALVCLSLVACKKHINQAQGPMPDPEPRAQVPPPAADAVQAMVQNFSRVSFSFDSAALSDGSHAALSANARILQDHPGLRIEVQGHADDRGTTDYNLALGERRATTIRKLLVAQGVSVSRVKTLSYGEERPLDPSAGETAWAENRRAEFRIIDGGDSAVAGTIP